MSSERVTRHIERLLDELDLALEAREWEKVRDLASDVLRLDPDNRDAAAFLAAAERDTVGASGSGTPSGEPDHTPTGPAAPETTPTSFANGRYQVTGSQSAGGPQFVVIDTRTGLAKPISDGLSTRLLFKTFDEIKPTKYK